MRTLFLFALALAGAVSLADDASAFGRRGRKAKECGCGNTAAYVAPRSACCGQAGVVYGSPNGAYGPTNSGYYYPNGGVYQSGYYTPGVSGTGVIPAGGTIDPRTGLPITPRTVPNPMPDRDKEIDKDK